MLALGLSSCKQDVNKPDFMPEQDKMASLLTEIHINEALTRYNYIQDRRKLNNYYKEILDNYGLSPEQFDSCIAWYSINNKEYQELYNIVTNKLEAEKQLILSRYYSKERPKSIWQNLDSIQQINGFWNWNYNKLSRPAEFGADDSCCNSYVERF